MKKIILLLFFISFLFACSNKENKSFNEITALSYKYHKKVIYDTKNQNDTLAEISYPLFNNEDLNKYLKGSILYFYAPIEETIGLANFDSISAEGIIRYDSYYHERYFPPKNWRLSMDIKVKINKKKYISISRKHIDYTNHKPGYVFMKYINYNLENNIPITLDSVIEESKRDEFSKICENIFRSKYGISSTSSLKDYFHYEEFQMPYDFYLDDRAIVFEYQPYHIKLKKGVDNILIVPFSSLRKVLKSNSIEELL